MALTAIATEQGEDEGGEGEEGEAAMIAPTCPACGKFLEVRQFKEMDVLLGIVHEVIGSCCVNEECPEHPRARFARQGQEWTRRAWASHDPVRPVTSMWQRAWGRQWVKAVAFILLPLVVALIGATIFIWLAQWKIR